MTAFQEFSAPVLSEFSKIMRDFEAAKSGLNKVVLVNGVPSDATHYDTFGGKTTHHRIDTRGAFYSDGAFWLRHRNGFEAWTVTKLGHFEPPRTNGSNVAKTVAKKEQRQVDYYPQSRRNWVGD